MGLNQTQLRYAENRIRTMANEAITAVKLSHKIPANPLTWQKFWDLVDSGAVGEPNFREFSMSLRHPFIYAFDLLPEDLRDKFFVSDKVSPEGDALVEKIEFASEAAIDKLMFGGGLTVVQEFAATLKSITT